MGTRAHWLKEGWRWRGFDRDGDPLSWAHCRTLADVRADVEADPALTEVEVQKYDRRAETYKPYGTLRRHRVTQKPRDHRYVIRLERVEP